ncbi:MAG: hypothetical protein RJB35_15, partial [Actinomycetota bacterium]
LIAAIPTFILTIPRTAQKESAQKETEKKVSYL